MILLAAQQMAVAVGDEPFLARKWPAVSHPLASLEVWPTQQPCPSLSSARYLYSIVSAFAPH